MRPRRPLMKYKHKELMNEVNNFFIAIKCHFYVEGLPQTMLENYPKPTPGELDEMVMKIISALEEQSEEMIKY